jgi:hypothetical protein
VQGDENLFKAGHSLYDSCDDPPLIEILWMHGKVFREILFHREALMVSVLVTVLLTVFGYKKAVSGERSDEEGEMHI